MHQLILKHPKLQQQNIATLLTAGQNGAIVCHRVGHDDEDDHHHHEKKEEKKKNDTEEPETETLLVEVVASRAKQWGAARASKENAAAVLHAVGDVPYGDVQNLSSAEMMLLLQDHVHDVVFDAIRRECGDGGAGGSSGGNNQPEHRGAFGAKGKRSKEERKKYEGLVNSVEMVPVHDEAEQKKIFSWIKFPSIEQIQQYYGDGPAWYHAWVEHYNQFLLFPTVVGLSIWAYNYATGLTVNTNVAVPFFSLAIILWGILFCKSWEQRTNELAMQFRSSYCAEVEQVRPQFRGAFVYNEVTKEYEQYYPAMKRYRAQAFSALVTIIMLCGAAFVQCCSLNLQGYMRGQHNEFEIEIIADLADPGAIFDANSDYMSMIPIVLHSVVIMFMNGQYCKVARWLTERENHKLQSEFDSALLVKRVAFEFFDIYLALFYIAFYRLDILQLRTELISLYMVDQFRRIAVESVLPLVLNWLGGLVGGEAAKKRKAAMKKPQAERTPEEIVEQVEEELVEYEGEFDNLLELLVGQLGLVSLFAAGMPLAGACSWLSNQAEKRSDLFKLTFLYRRPPSIKAKGIGPWSGVMKMFAYASILTNVILFGFTSDQITWFFPQYFDPVTTDPLPGYGRAAVAVVFILEHAVLFIVLLIDFLVPEQTEATAMELKARRIKYVRDAHLLSSTSASSGALDEEQMVQRGGGDKKNN